MTFEEMDTAMTADCFVQLGTEAIFRPQSGAAVSTRAVVRHGVEVTSAEPPFLTERRTVIQVPQAEVPGCKRGDVIEVSAHLWKVEREVDKDGMVLKVIVR